MSAPRILFVLKYREDTSSPSHVQGSGKGLSSGLYNSAKFVSDMLTESGVEAKMVQVIDNNGIDREVTEFRPTHVIIEALWVVPEKFEVLQKLHPQVKWIVRGHSELPFLANEGIAMDWLHRYLDYENVVVAFNSKKSVRDIRNLVKTARPYWERQMVNDRVIMLPNFYPHARKNNLGLKTPDQYFDVGCFGAIRPMKNHLIQAAAAIEYANLMGKTLRFHVNGSRTEQKGDNVLRNLRALFANSKHELVEHGWMSHEDFLAALRGMDMGMQITFSETFNIVAADMVVTGLPIVVSPEILWTSTWCQAVPTDAEDIVLKMMKANDWRLKLALRVLNLRGLRHYCEASRAVWLEYLRNGE